MAAPDRCTRRLGTGETAASRSPPRPERGVRSLRLAGLCSKSIRYGSCHGLVMPELGHCRSGVGVRAATLWAEDIGLLDILINNAAAYVDWSEMASTADLDAAERVMQVNLFGSWRIIQAFCRC